MGDGARIRQVVTNLVGNAIKFTASGHVLVSVERAEQGTQSSRMRISVEDTGVGIPQEKAGLLFEKFSQVDGSTTRKYGGTGLGLAISKQLVHLMGGSIGVESRLGEGSTFWFELPLEPDTEADGAPLLGGGVAGLRVLILGDNPVCRRLLEEQITDWGARCGSFADGERARQAMRTAQEAGEPYQLVLLDGPLREGEGIAFASAIRSDPSLRGCAIAMAGFIGQWEEPSHAGSGIFDVRLNKPVRQTELFHTLVSVWAKRQGTEPSQSLGAKPKADRKQAPAGSFATCDRRILVAEDNVINQKVACRLLERLGLRTDVAVNGREAVEMSALAPYDLILMDCQMPEMDGYEATREIRRREGSTRHAAVIAMTADAVTGCRERCLAAGMDDYVTKPVRPDELYHALRRWLPLEQPSQQ
jgi:CheY-like chemotaxis protein